MDRQAEKIRKRYAELRAESARLVRLLADNPDNGNVRGQLHAVESWKLDYSERYAALPISERTLSF